MSDRVADTYKPHQWQRATTQDGRPILKLVCLRCQRVCEPHQDPRRMGSCPDKKNFEDVLWRIIRGLVAEMDAAIDADESGDRDHAMQHVKDAARMGHNALLDRVKEG